MDNEKILDEAQVAYKSDNWLVVIRLLEPVADALDLEWKSKLAASYLSLGQYNKIVTLLKSHINEKIPTY